jgi:hypothetical protein
MVSIDYDVLFIISICMCLCVVVQVSGASYGATASDNHKEIPMMPSPVSNPLNADNRNSSYTPPPRPAYVHNDNNASANAKKVIATGESKGDICAHKHAYTH